MVILGLSGKRGVGKTTLANYLCDQYNFIKVSFADELKALAQRIFPFTAFDFSSPRRKEAPFQSYEWTPREFLINLGEFVRYHDKDYWLKKAMARCDDNRGRYVFDDVRYINEAEAIKSTGNGYIVRINRFEKNNPYGKPLDVESETQLDDYKFDFVVEDCVNTSLKQLHQQGDLIVKTFL